MQLTLQTTTAGNLGHKRIVLEQHVLALSADLANASAILTNRAGEIVNFASELPTNCDREEAARRISTFIESLYPPSSSLQSGHATLGEIIANRVTANPVTWTLALTTIGLVAFAAMLIAN